MKVRTRAALLILILSVAVYGSILAVENHSRSDSTLVHIFCSFLLAAISLKSSIDPEQRSTWEAGRRNIKEAQRLLQEKPYGIFKYASRKAVFGHDDPITYSVDGILEEPLIWVFCIAVYAAIFFTPAYFEYDKNDMPKVIRLALYNLGQMILLTAAIFGILTVVRNKIRGDKK